MSRPLIGLSATNEPQADWGERAPLLDRDAQGRQYSQAVARAGGLPFILPLLRGGLSMDAEGQGGGCGPGPVFDNARIYMERLDGLLLCGGGDLAPPPMSGADEVALYRLVDKSRDIWETALLAAALELKKPVLGICRGLQLINIALGGSLYADLPSQRPGPVEHQQAQSRSKPAHPVDIVPDSRLASILKARQIMVNSGHHQGLERLAGPLKSSATAPDGLVEAVEHSEADFVVAVQWHPEGQPLSPHSRALFEAFVRAASEGRG